MINEKLVDNIRSHGTFRDTDEGKRRVLENIGFKTGEKAKYVIITGCAPPESMPHTFRAFKGLLDYFSIDYTLLVKEFCCGWAPIVQPALSTKNEETIAVAKEFVEEFILNNFRQAEALGAESIVLFCVACEPLYTNYAKATNLEIISYYELIDRYFSSGKLNLEVDYYAGCYRFRRRITTEPIDIEPAMRMLAKIEGLKLSHVDNKLCCYIPPHREELISSLTTQTLITICTGCYNELKKNLQGKYSYQVKMLPEVILEAISPQ